MYWYNSQLKNYTSHILRDVICFYIRTYLCPNNANIIVSFVFCKNIRYSTPVCIYYCAYAYSLISYSTVFTWPTCAGYAPGNERERGHQPHLPGEPPVLSSVPWRPASVVRLIATAPANCIPISRFPIPGPPRPPENHFLADGFRVPGTNQASRNLKFLRLTVSVRGDNSLNGDQCYKRETIIY